MERRPVLYLDLDDTLVSWSTGSPAAAAGAREFVLWALTRFEVRWLTTWCPDGQMPLNLLDDLAHILELSREALNEIRGVGWDGTGSKLNGIAWLEHVVLGRPFIWLEDDKGMGDVEKRGLADAGFSESYVHCNVTTDPCGVSRVRSVLMNWLGANGAVE